MRTSREGLPNHESVLFDLLCDEIHTITSCQEFIPLPGVEGVPANTLYS